LIQQIYREAKLIKIRELILLQNTKVSRSCSYSIAIYYYSIIISIAIVLILVLRLEIVVVRTIVKVIYVALIFNKYDINIISITCV